MTVHWGGRGPGHMSRGMGSFNPLSLFAAGEKGGIWLPENSGVSVGTGVATVTDASTNAKNATQGTAGNKPILRQNATTGALYWEFDGTDDFFTTPSIDFSGTDAITVFAAIRKLSDAASAAVVELSASGSNGSVGLFAPLSALANFEWRSRGTATAQATTANSFAAPISAVLTGSGVITTDTATLRVNGVQAATSSADQGIGNFGNFQLYIGRRGGTSLPFNGHIYALIVLGRVATAAEITTMESFLNRRIGAY